MTMETLSTARAFGGTQGVYSHTSETCGCDMTFAVYTPPQAADGPVPILWFLSGLTCTHENAMVKAGAQAHAAKHGLMLVFPDTSPRGTSTSGQVIADDEAYDLGQGAGFYVDATQAPWAPNFSMYSYITKELPALITANFPANMATQGLTGHSMGGHGAMTLALRNPDTYKSVSAFAPIVSPTTCPWGEKALGTYLGDDRKTWEAHDSVKLIESNGWHNDILVDQGEADNFLEEQLQPHLLAEACKTANVPLTLRLQPGYDHSYFFIATFMEDHITWAADRLKS